MCLLQGVTNPFDNTYTPTTPTEIAQFDVDQTYIYSICDEKIKYPSGRLQISNHSATEDGRALLKALTDDAEALGQRRQNGESSQEALRWTRCLEQEP